MGGLAQGEAQVAFAQHLQRLLRADRVGGVGGGQGCDRGQEEQ